MKRISLWMMILLTVVALSGCGYEYEEMEVRGQLFSDSSLTTPISGVELKFMEVWIDPYYENYDTQDFGDYLGTAVTDREGRWGFQFVTNLENPYMNSKFTFDRSYRGVAIIYDGSVIYKGGINDSNLMRLYPGCWPPASPSDTTAVVAPETDTLSGKGGAR